MRKTSDFHGFTVVLETEQGDRPWNSGKVYKTHKSASSILGKVVCGIDDGTVQVAGFRYAKVVEVFGE